MAEHPKYGGSSPGDWEDLIQYAQTQGRATDEMRQKTDELRQVEERVEQSETRSARTRTGLAGATEELTRVLAANVDALRAENMALEASIGLMERSLTLRRQLSSTPVVAPGERSAAASTATSGAEARTNAATAPASALVTDPQAAQRVRDAEAALAQAQIERERLRQEVRTMQASAARPSGPTVTERATYAQRQTGVAVDPNRLRALEQIEAQQQYRPTPQRVAQVRQLEEAGLVERVRPAPRPSAPAPRRQQAPAPAPAVASPAPQREAQRQPEPAPQSPPRTQPTQPQPTQPIAQLDQAIAEETEARRRVARAEVRQSVAIEEQLFALRQQAGLDITPNELRTLSEAEQTQRGGQAFRPAPGRERTVGSLTEAGLLEPVAPWQGPNPPYRPTPAGLAALEQAVPTPETHAAFEHVYQPIAPPAEQPPRPTEQPPPVLGPSGRRALERIVAEPVVPGVQVPTEDVRALQRRGFVERLPTGYYGPTDAGREALAAQPPTAPRSAELEEAADRLVTARRRAAQAEEAEARASSELSRAQSMAAAAARRAEAGQRAYVADVPGREVQIRRSATQEFTHYSYVPSDEQQRLRFHTTEATARRRAERGFGTYGQTQSPEQHVGSVQEFQQQAAAEVARRREEVAALEANIAALREETASRQASGAERVTRAVPSAAGAPPRESEPPERPPAPPTPEPAREPEPMPAQPPREPPRPPRRPVAQPPEEPEERPTYRLTPAGEAALAASRNAPPPAPEDIAAKQRELQLANENVAASDAELQAARNNAALAAQAERERAQHVENLRRINAEDEAERRAIGERIAQAAATVGEPPPLMLGPGPAEPAPRPGPSSPWAPTLNAAPEQAIPMPAAGVGTTTGAPGRRPVAPRPDEEAVTVGVDDEGAPMVRSLGSLRQEAAANAEAVRRLGGEQMAANQAFQEASAVYADNSSRLTRHGALTTEFIQSLARGQVTLREFGEQMTATVGKFGGWAIAGAAVYGVVEMFRQLARGATESQAAIQNLGRFIPGLGGPAGGGTGQVSAGYAALRNISTEFNVPISEVGNPMQIMARIFPNLRDASDATRAVLAASRLDQVPVQQSTQYLTGISQSLGFTHGSQLINRVIDPLNALQSLTGARVAETLPAIARAAPAARAANVSLPQLEALTAMGVRAGIPGAQVGTAALRSFGTFAWRPQGQETLAQYGVTAPYGDTGALLTNLFGMIDERARRRTGASGPTGTGPLSGPDLRNLAQALGGPLLGTRTILPILAAEQNNPGAFSRDIQIARRPRPYQEDLGAMLGSVGERFRAIGISLENFGNQLASAGLLTPVKGLLDAFTLLTHTVEQLASPLTEVLSVFNRIPGVVRDALGVFVAFRAGSALMQSRFGTGAQMYLGRLPGLSALRGGEASARFAVQGIQGNLERELLPVDRRAAESASLRLRQVRGQYLDAQNEVARYAQTQRPSDFDTLQPDDPRAVAYNEGLTQRRRRVAAFEGEGGAVARAEGAEADALERVNRTQAQIAFAKNDQYTWTERARVLESEGFFALSDTVDAQRELAATYAARVEAVRRGEEIPGAQTLRPAPMAGGAALAGAPSGAPSGAPPPPAPTATAVGEAAVIAGATGAIGAAATELAREPGPLGDLQQGVAEAGRAQPVPVGPSRPAPEEPPPPAPPSWMAADEPTWQFPPPAGAGRAAADQWAARAAPQPAPAAERNVMTWGAMGDFARTQAASLTDQLRGRTGGLRATVAEAGGPLPYVRAQASGAVNAMASNPMAAFGGLMATQLIGSALPGGFGSFVQSVGGDAMTGLIAAQMLRPGSGAATMGGLGAGLLLGGRQAGGVMGGLASGVGGAMAARGALSAVTALAPFDAIAPEVALPLQAAAAIGGFLFGAGGGQQSGADAQNQANAQAAGGVAAAHRTAQQAGGGGAEGVAENLVTAYMGSGSSSQSAQANITAQMNRATAQLQMFGPDSAQGRAANQSLGDILAAAYTLAPTMPAASQQLIQQVTQARQPVTQDEFAYRLSQQTGATPGNQATTRLDTQLAQLRPRTTDDALQQIMSGGPFAQVLAGRLPQANVTVAVPGSAAERAATEYQAMTVGQPYQQYLDYRETYRAAEQRLAEARQSGRPQRIAAAQADAGTQWSQFRVAQRTYQLAQERATPVEEQFYSQQMQQSQQALQAQGTLAAAQAGGNPIAQLQAQLANQRRIAALTQTYQGRISPVEFQRTIDEQRAQVAQTQTQLTQQGLGPIAARGQLAVAQAPIGDPVAQAQAQWQAYAAQLQYMQRNQHAFDPSQIVGMQAQATAAWKTIATTQESYNTQMTQINTQIAQQRDAGNAVAQAADAAAGAAQQATQARTPTGRAQARLSQASAAVQEHQAAMQRIQESAQLQAAQQWADPQAQAQALMAAARNEQRNAHGIDEQIAAQTAYAQAQQQSHQATMSLLQAQGQVAAAQAQLTGDPRAVATANAATAQRQLRAAVGPQEHAAAYANLLQAQQAGYDAQQQVVQMQGQLAEAQQAGNPVGAAQAAQRSAQTELQYAHGLQQRIAAETALAQANYQAEQAQVSWQESLGQLAASQTVDPVEALRRQVQGTSAALSRARTPQARVEVQTQLNNTTHQYEQQLIDQRGSVIDFQFQMMQITAGQAVAQLNDLLRLRGITRAQRQSLLEQVRRYQLGLEQPIGASGFDLAPGGANVRLPTYYDVAHAITSARPGGVAQAHNSRVDARQYTTIEVNVHNRGDVAAVAEAIDRTTSGHLRQRLRAVGLR